MTFGRIIRITLMSLGLFLVILLIYGYAIGQNKYEVHHQTMYFSDLPKAFEGYRVLHISDLHVGTFRNGREKQLDNIVQMANEQKCDVIVFTGDLVNRRTNELDGFKRTLSKLKAHDGVFSVTGNHDYSQYAHFETEKEQKADVEQLHRREKEYGWNLLLNEHRFIHRGKDSIAIVGVENWGEPPFPQYGDIVKASKGIKRSNFCVLLSHDPSHWKAQVVPITSFQLTLSGHTHAGQFKVFGWSPCKWKYKLWTGTHIEGSQVLSISEGIGGWLPFRFGAWPEMNVITLRRK